MKYEDWLQMDETLSFKKKLIDDLEVIKEDWSEGLYGGDTSAEIIKRNYVHVGMCQAIKQVIESLTEKEHEIESEGVQGSY